MDDWTLSKKEDFRFFVTRYMQICIPEIREERDRDRTDKIVACYTRKNISDKNLRIFIDGVNKIIFQFGMPVYERDHEIGDKESVCGIKAKDGHCSNPASNAPIDNGVICAYQFKTVWIIAAFDIDDPNNKNEKSQSKLVKSMKSRPEINQKSTSYIAVDAFSTIYNDVFLALIEAGV